MLTVCQQRGGGLPPPRIGISENDFLNFKKIIQLCAYNYNFHQKGNKKALVKRAQNWLIFPKIIHFSISACKTTSDAHEIQTAHLLGTRPSVGVKFSGYYFLT